MEYTAINMGEIIRDLRKSRSLTQEALAQAAGVSIQAVSKWETGQSLPDVTLLPMIADFFGVTVDALFGREADTDTIKEAPEPAQDAQPAAPASPFPDDSKLRVAQYMGSRLMSAEECTDGREIRLLIDEARSQADPGSKLEFEIQGSARINGTVNGSLKTLGDAYISANVNGSATAEGDITCNGNINGSARAGGSISARSGAFTAESISDSLSGFKVSLSGLGNMVSGMFSGKRMGGAAGAHMNAFFRGELPDDDVIRVVQMQGRRVMSAEESADQKVIRLTVEHMTDPLNVEVYGSAQIEGDIHGNATAGDSLTCGSVSGNAQAGDSLTCGDVGGNANAGDGVTCGAISGSVTAGDGVTCGPVGGSVRAGDSAHVTGDVGGNVTASDSVTCGSIQGDVKADRIRCVSLRGSSIGGKKQEKGSAACSGDAAPDLSSLGVGDGALHVVQVMGGRVLSDEESSMHDSIRLCLEDADGITVHVHGSAQIDGDIEGDVHADGSVSCGDVEGDVSAGGSVKCESVEGDVKAGGSATCENVEGDVTAGSSVNCAGVEGDVSAGGTVNCAAVEGSVTVQGNSTSCSVNCAGVEGDVTALNASVNCGDGAIGGQVYIRCDRPNACSVCCGGVEGDVTALNASVNCGEGVICGDIDARGNQSEKSIVICTGIEGDVTAVNASVNCREGVIGGDVEVRSDRPDKCVVICTGIEGRVTSRNASVNCRGVIGGDVDAEGESDEE